MWFTCGNSARRRPGRSGGLWSHAGGVPVHIHFVVQPVTRTLMDSIDDYGPHLQVAMFDAGATPPKGEVERFAERARAALGT